MRPRLILSVIGLAVAAILIKPAQAPLYVLNLSSSVPVGLYRLQNRNPHRGGLAVIRLSQPWRDLAASRGYLPRGIRLIKPIAALAGDRVCRFDGRITINGRLAALAQQEDEMGRVLPEWAGCKTLIEGELFLLSSTEGSFDGRYFGVTPQSAWVANAVPVSGRLREWFLDRAASFDHSIVRDQRDRKRSSEAGVRRTFLLRIRTACRSPG